MSPQDKPAANGSEMKPALALPRQDGMGRVRGTAPAAGLHPALPAKACQWASLKTNPDVPLGPTGMSLPHRQAKAAGRGELDGDGERAQQQGRCIPTSPNAQGLSEEPDPFFSSCTHSGVGRDMGSAQLCCGMSLFLLPSSSTSQAATAPHGAAPTPCLPAAHRPRAMLFLRGLSLPQLPNPLCIKNDELSKTGNNNTK